MAESPFLTHKNVLMNDYGAAKILRRATLSMWNGQAYPFDFSRIILLDQMHMKIFVELTIHYNLNGENDKDFLEIAYKCAEIEGFE